MAAKQNLRKMKTPSMKPNTGSQKNSSLIQESHKKGNVNASSEKDISIVGQKNNFQCILGSYGKFVQPTIPKNQDLAVVQNSQNDISPVMLTRSQMQLPNLGSTGISGPPGQNYLS